MPPPADQARPAIGAGGRLPRRILIRRYALALVLLLLLGFGKILIAQGAVKVVSITPPDRVLTAGLLIGNTPRDTDLQEFAADLKVDGVVNLSSPDVAEQVTAASLHQDYLYLPVPPNDSPTWSQLRSLVTFMRRHTGQGASVYVHDDVGGGRAVITAVMLLLLRGETWPAVSAEFTPAELRTMCNCQRLALARLRSALQHIGQSPAANPYAAARLDPW